MRNTVNANEHTYPFEIDMDGKNLFRSNKPAFLFYHDAIVLIWRVNALPSYCKRSTSNEVQPFYPLLSLSQSDSRMRFETEKQPMSEQERG